MTTSLDKAVYLKIWQQVNPLNDPLIKTQKTIQWIQALLKRQELSGKEQQSTKQPKGKDKKLSDAIETKKNDRKSVTKNKNDLETNQKPKNITQTNKKQPIAQNDTISPSKEEINEQVILSYIKKYSQTDQYKLLSKSYQNLTQPEPMKQEKQKKGLSKQPSKKLTKKTEPKVPETKYDQNLINLTYEEAIFFYYWFKKIYQKDSKQRFLEKIKKQQQSYEQQKLKLQQNQGSKENQTSQNTYQPKHFVDLTERQMSYINEQSFLSLKQHEPKLSILFKHYAKLSHVLTKQIFTFDQRNSLQKMISLHQWMIFCKEWNILNAKNINQGWEAGKVTRQFLMDVYYKNSFLRKQMPFEMFLRAIISVSCRMYQDCDIYKVKPIDLMLNFLSIKNEQKFIENLETKNISYRQGDILSCFKVKDRDVYEKMHIIRVTGTQKLKKSHFTLLRQRNLTDRFKAKEEGLQSHRTQRNSQKWLEKTPSEVNLQSHNQLSNLHANQSILNQNYTTGNLSKLSLTRKNRKSAPQIGFKLPSIEQNKFFTPIPQNNHLNKFKQYIDNQVPQSSSVFRNKITGYHKIHSIQSQQEQEKLGLRNRMEHLRISKMIGGKLQGLVGEMRVNPERQSGLGRNRNVGERVIG